MNLRTLHRINRVLTPVIDLVFVALLTTTLFFGIEFFFDVLVPFFHQLATR